MGEDKYELTDPAANGTYSNFEEPKGYNYSPQNPLAGLGQLNTGGLQAGVGGLAIPQKGPDYLNYDIQGRGWSERTFLNVGTTYLTGIGLGGTYGFFEGMRSSPSRKFNIRLNTVLNKMGKRGSAAGNAIGCVALIFSLTDAFCEKMLESDRFFDSVFANHRTLAELGTPLMAGVLTGAFYKSTAGPRTMLVAAMIGGVFAVAADGTRRFLSI